MICPYGAISSIMRRAQYPTHSIFSSRKDGFMYIIRTPAVELSTIPALAYKQKLLAAGGAGVKLIRLDQDATAVYTIDRRTGEGEPYGKVDEKLFPREAVEEAIELTLGIPYSKRGKLNVKAFETQKEREDVAEDDGDDIDMVGSDEYEAICERYGDEKGKLNYQLLNKDFIQFASKSKVVGEMIASGAQEDNIVRFIVKSRATFLTGKKESLSDKETDALIETLDEINPRSAFKELKSHIRRQLAKPSAAGLA